MSRILGGRAVVTLAAAAVAAATAVPVPATAAAGPPAAARASRAAAAPSAAPSAPPAARVSDTPVVTLVTGDRVAVRQRGGQTLYAVLPARRSGPGAALQTYRLGQRTYVMPVVASAYLGRQLDPSLFDLALQPTGAQARFRVTIRHTGSAPTLPGVTVTADSAGVASGYVTPSSAAAFGAALVRQWLRDQGAVSGADLFAGITRISAAAAPGPAVDPHFTMYTLVVKGINAWGGRMRFGGGLLMNVDDGRKYAGFLQIEDGQARVSVPAGRYGGSVDWVGLAADGSVVLRQIPIPTYRVSGAGQTLVVDARQATARPGATTPKPVSSTELVTEYSRTDEAGFGGIGSALSFDGRSDFAVKPVGPVTVGTQRFALTFHGTTDTASPYTYDLSWADDRVRPDQHHSVGPAQLATVKTRFAVDQPRPESLMGRYAIDPSAPFFFTSLYPVQAPGSRTYYLGGEAATWGSVQWGDVRADDLGELSSARRYPHGSSSSEVWRRGPLAAGIPVNTAVDPFPLCWACRTADAVQLVLSPFGDSDPSHRGSLYASPDGSPVAHLTLTKGDQVLVDADDQLGAVVPAGTGPAAYRAVLDVDRFWTGATTSVRTRTELTFGPGTQVAAPGSWACFAGPDCRVLPVLQSRLSYPGSLTATVRAGTVRFEVDAARVQGAAPAGVTGATLSLRPAGFGWADFPLTRVGPGRYRADVELPDYLVGSAFDVRHGATDAGGSSFDQTVVRAFTLAAPATSASPASPSAAARGATGAGWARPAVRAACAPATGSSVTCLSRWRPGAGAGLLAPRSRAGAASAEAAPADGYGPGDIAAAYRLDRSTGTGQTIGVVVAYDNPNAERDLAVYRRAWGLPPCTTANGCFRKVNQRGGSTPPPGDPGWGLEIALDVQAVSAVCPRCKILLVEADTPSVDDIGKAVNRAVALGADAVSNSYGTAEFGSARELSRRYYTHPGVAQVVASGDFGFGPAQYPAVLPQAIAVGGTTLRRTSSGWAERAWSGSGSGCSAWFAKPVWQQDRRCSMRTTADLSAVGDPETGFAVYDTYGLGAANGWVVVGGTSLSAPLVAGMIGLAGNAPQLGSARWIYNHRSALRDVVGGSNGYCGGDYLCTARRGYDAPTGLGSPRGTGAL